MQVAQLWASTEALPAGQRRNRRNIACRSDRGRHARSTNLLRTFDSRSAVEQHRTHGIARSGLRLPLRLRHDLPAPLPLGRAVDHLHDHRVRLHQDRRPVHDQQLDDAAEAEPGHARADPRPLRERLRRPVRADDDPQGPAHRLQPRPAGRQAHRLPRVRHGQQLPDDGGRDREPARATTRRASSRRWTAGSSMRPASPNIS